MQEKMTTIVEKKMLFRLIGIEHAVVTVMVGVTG
jgi:hypothetical protein